VKLSTMVVFGAGYVLGTRAGRERYDQLRALASQIAEQFDGSGAQQRLLDISSRLETYARDNRSNANAKGTRAQTKA
jgi:hypothetical protein